MDAQQLMSPFRHWRISRLFSILGLTNKDATNIHVCISVWTEVSLFCMSKIIIVKSCGSCIFNYLGNCFPEWLCHFKFSQAKYEQIIFLHLPQHLLWSLFFFFFFKFSLLFNIHLGITHVILICISLMCIQIQLIYAHLLVSHKLIELTITTWITFFLVDFLGLSM